MKSSILISGFATLFLIAAGATSAQDSTSVANTSHADGNAPRWNFRGYVKLLQTVEFAPLAEVRTDNLLHNRLNLKWYPSKGVTVSAEARNRLFYGTSDSLRGLNRAENLAKYDGVLPLENNWVDYPDLTLNTVVDRLWVDYSIGDFAFRAGRQRINWALNTVWNPNDWFNTFNYLDFDYEERPGADAVLGTWYPGAMSSVDVAYKWGTTPDDDVAALKYKFNTHGYDVQVLVGKYRTDAALGLGWAGGIGGAGFKTEVSLFAPWNDPAAGLSDVSLATQLDYSFPNGLYVLGSYLYNSAGSYTPSFLTSFYMGSPSPKLLMPSAHSAFASAQYTFSPILSAQFATMYGFGLNWLILYPTLTYSLKENWDIDLVAQIFANESPLNGNFRNRANALYFRLKWSF